MTLLVTWMLQIPRKYDQFTCIVTVIFDKAAISRQTFLDFGLHQLTFTPRGDVKKINHSNLIMGPFPEEKFFL